MGLTLGKGPFTGILHRAEEPTIPPIHPATRETHFVGPQPADAHNDPDLVPAVGCRVLDPDVLANLQSRKRLGMLVVPSCRVLGTGSCTAVTVFSLGLPVLRE